jgi:ABC-type multidrug transport system fused ATPase/permease subunit
VTLLAGFCGLDVDHLLQAENYLAMLERIPSAREAQRSSSPPSDDRSRGSTFSDESASPSSHQSAIDTVDHDTGNGSVHVSSTPSTDVPGLDNFSVEIEAGNTIAIVGKEGSIYSTVFSLLVGPVAILAKCISIGGVNLQNMGTYQVQDEIGTISQDPTLLNDTVLESVRDARPNATHLDVYLACDAACISYLEMLFAGQYDASTPGSNRDGTPVSRYLVSISDLLRDANLKWNVGLGCSSLFERLQDHCP